MGSPLTFCADFSRLLGGCLRFPELGTPRGVSPERATVLQKIGRYEIDEELGRGAMGVVYRARDPQIGRTVAIKVILTGNASPQDLERYKLRFGREAQAAGRMSHPGIVTIHDIAEDENGQPYLVMEYIEGAPLDFLMVPPAPRPSINEILDIAIQVAHALDYAHRHGVIHRDIKPANILVTPDGHAKIADFGIAKLAGTEMTQEGHSVGTPSFMSPEQFRGSGIDARSDIFSFGAVLYWMCTGKKPFVGESITEVSFKIAFDAPAPALQQNAALPPGLDAVLSRCLAKLPSERYANCGELAADLELLRGGQPLKTPASRPAKSSAPPAMERTTPALAATQAVVSPLRWVKTRRVALSLLLVGLAGGAYWLWPGTRGEAVTPKTNTASTAPPRNESPAALPPRDDSPSPAPTAAEERNPKAVERKTAAESTLRIYCEHNFRSATLEVFSDDKPLLQTTLHGRGDDYAVMKIYEGKLETSRPIAPGNHTLRVRVTSRRDGYSDVAEISGTFAENISQTLAIEFGKGSGLHVFGRKLALSWR